MEFKCWQEMQVRTALLACKSVHAALKLLRHHITTHLKYYQVRVLRHALPLQVKYPLPQQGSLVERTR